MKTQILFEDRDLLVCCKPAGIAVQSGRISEPDMVSELKNYLAQSARQERARSGEKGVAAPVYLGVIHRLDQPVSGIMVFAKNPGAAAALSRQAAGTDMKKTYRAVVFLPEKEKRAAMAEADSLQGVPGDAIACSLIDYIKKEPGGGARIAGPQEKEAKRAELSWRCLAREGQRALLEIELKTGRHHQIRVQLAHAGMPLLGDNRYGTAESRALSGRLGIEKIQLQAAELTFLHPVTKKRVCFEAAEKLQL